MTKEDLKKRLTEEEYRVTQEKGTEAPFSGKYWNEHADGTYHCKVCDAPLFASSNKFDSTCGWPSFDDAISGSVLFADDHTFGMNRTEVTCASCGSHLGHIFDDGPKETTGKRYCINSVSLDLKQ